MEARSTMRVLRMKRLGGQVNPRYDKEAERLVGRTQNAVWNISGYVISKKPSTV